MMNIHPTAIISEKAKIATSATIGPYCIIGADVEIGNDCSFLSHVVVKGPTIIEEGNIFYQFSTIGEDTPDKKYKGEKTKLLIGKKNIFREGVTIHRGTIQDKNETIIGNENLFMAYTHVAHDCIVGDNNVFANNAGIAGHVVVGNNITIGALTTIHQFCKIGDFSFVGMNTSITMDVPAFVKVAADPARVVGLNSVGMTRGGIDQKTIALIKKAYKVLYRRNLKIQEALSKLEIIYKETSNENLNVFIKSISLSERGILR